MLPLVRKRSTGDARPRAAREPLEGGAWTSGCPSGRPPPAVAAWPRRPSPPPAPVYAPLDPPIAVSWSRSRNELHELLTALPGPPHAHGACLSRDGVADGKCYELTRRRRRRARPSATTSTESSTTSLQPVRAWLQPRATSALGRDAIRGLRCTSAGQGRVDGGPHLPRRRRAPGGRDPGRPRRTGSIGHVLGSAFGTLFAPEGAYRAPTERPAVSPRQSTTCTFPQVSRPNAPERRWRSEYSATSEASRNRVRRWSVRFRHFCHISDTFATNCGPLSLAS